MANFRQVHTRIWKDNWFLELDPTHKLFFIYLFTNECASISGIYELSKRVMSFESGLMMSEIDAAFEAFGQANKAFYQDGVVWVRNLRKYHETQSPKVQSKIQADVDAVKECELKVIYCKEYGIDRVSIPPYTYSVVSSKSVLEEVAVENEHTDMITALAKTVKETLAPGFNEDKFSNAAGALIAKGIKPGQLDGFIDWWAANGHYAGKPSLTSVLQEIDNYINGVTLTPSRNGRQSINQEPVYQDRVY